MFFIISKIFGYFISPIIWISILVGIALFAKKTRLRRKSLTAAFIILIVFSNSFLITKIVGLWIVNPVKISNNYDVGIVLGGRTVTYDQEYNRLSYHGTIDRLLQAVDLYEKGKIKKILITGGSASLIYKKFKEANLMDSLLRIIKIPDSVVLIDTLAQNTHQNAVYSKKILEKYPHLTKYLLITSSMHMRRAIRCYEKVGLHVTPYPANLINPHRRLNIDYLFIPHAANFLIWDGTLHEILGYLVYKIMGFV